MGGSCRESKFSFLPHIQREIFSCHVSRWWNRSRHRDGEVLAEIVEIIQSSEFFLLFLLKSVSGPDSVLLTWMVFSSQAVNEDVLKELYWECDLGKIESPL